MRTVLMIVTVALCLFLASFVRAGQRDVREVQSDSAAVQFRVARLVVDAGDQILGAYQVVLDCDPKAISIVGIEGGVPPQFAGLPAYDRRGLASGKVRLAAFSLDEQGPKGKVCVARLHLALMAPDAMGSMRVTREVVATPRGDRTEAEVGIEILEPAKTATGAPAEKAQGR